MDTHILAAILGRCYNSLYTTLKQKIFYVEKKLKKIENPTDSERFLLERNEEEIEDIKTLLCLIERSLFPPCGADQEENKVSEEDLEILNYLKRNESILIKIKERIPKKT
jgi:hypothetical protein